MPKGQDLIQTARKHVGEKYVYGCECPLDNPAWRGPWDCAEFVSWCAYQAYGIVFGARPGGSLLNAYSGHWVTDAQARNAFIPTSEAFGIPGAILLRKPGSDPNHRDGHVAISLGDGTSIEAKSTKDGVGVFSVANRPWTHGVLLPGVEYDPPGKVDIPSYTATVYALKKPCLKGPVVRTIQAALNAAGIDPGGLDGVFGPLTHAAVLAFQVSRNLTPDGMVGKESATALGLAWPIVPLPDDLWSAAAAPSGVTGEEPATDGPRPSSADPSVDESVTFVFDTQDGHHVATASTGRRFYLGTPYSYRASGDIPRRGLYQGTGRLSQIAFAGVYSPDDFADSHPGWNVFIHPIILAESGGYFGRVNSYDRAGFTFGCPQFAAHTPEANLILLFRALLALPDAPAYFPDLRLEPDSRGRPVVHRVDKDGGARNLELIGVVTRPNGEQSRQLLDFMRYLNASPVEVDQAELMALARLMLWCGESEKARAAQVDLAVATLRGKLAAAAKKIPDLAGRPWPVACMVCDILHQGRGYYSRIATALAAADPLEALSRVSIGDPPVNRIKTVRAAMARIEAEGRLAGWSPWDDVGKTPQP